MMMRAAFGSRGLMVATSKAGCMAAGCAGAIAVKFMMHAAARARSFVVGLCPGSVFIANPFRGGILARAEGKRFAHSRECPIMR
jgi:hypothetical protein